MSIQRFLEQQVRTSTDVALGRDGKPVTSWTRMQSGKADLGPYADSVETDAVLVRVGGADADYDEFPFPDGPTKIQAGWTFRYSLDVTVDRG